MSAGVVPFRYFVGGFASFGFFPFLGEGLEGRAPFFLYPKPVASVSSRGAWVKRLFAFKSVEVLRGVVPWRWVEVSR